MAEFLSPTWLDELDAAARASTLLTASGREPLKLALEVRGSPHGDVRYHVVVDTSGTRVHQGVPDAPALTLVTDYVTAVALNRGEVNAQSAIKAGAAQVRGDLVGLVRHAELLAVIDDVFADVRAVTTYAPDHGCT